MHNKLIQSNKQVPDSTKFNKSPKKITQHGIFHSNAHFPILLAVPSETLTHITSSLEPHALFSLSGTNKKLHDHISDDNTWYRAFLCQFLDIGPENDARDEKSLMVRRTESSWKKEFVLRCNLRYRWEKSRTSTVTYSPLNSIISSVHLISESCLLASSIQYGVVARSNPLTGKVYRGYLDAGGTLNGLGIGNPNAEFSPNVSTCAFASEGGTAYIMWGFRNGEVAVTVANRVMDTSRSGGARLIKCDFADEHDGAVTDGIWGASGNLFASAGIDGRAKLWDGRTVRCLWSSPRDENGPVPEPCTKLAFDDEYGVVAVAMKSGEILIWTGLPKASAEQYSSSVPVVAGKVTIPPHSIDIKSDSSTQSREFASLAIISYSDSRLSLLINRQDDPLLYRINVDLQSQQVTNVMRFGDEHNGPLGSIKPFFARQEGEFSFIVTGDKLGCISIFNWDASPASSGALIQPHRRFDAFIDGSGVTCIEWNPTVLITGSSNGAIKVWDSLTFAPLRSFVSPGSKPRGGEWESVKQVALLKDLLIIAVGDKVMSWKAGPVKKGNGKVIIHGGKKQKNNGLAKWQQQLELHREVVDSKRDLEEEQKNRRDTYGREKDQLGSLDALGLNEREALEYVLMLSRDEEERRRATGDFSVHDDVFLEDFDSTSMSSSAAFSPSSPPRPGRHSNDKVQLSPRSEQEPVAAGPSRSPVSIGRTLSLQSIASEDAFPAMSSSASSTSTASANRTSVVGSPGSTKSAWSTPLKSSPPSGPATGSPGNNRRQLHQDATPQFAESEEDRDLRLAIELSLAEARIRGEVV